MIKKFLFAITISVIAVLPAISSETVNQVISRMKGNNLSSAFGENKEDGSFFIVSTKTTISPNMNPNQTEELARVQAKKNIAAFLGQNITSNEETSMLEKTVSVDGEEENEMIETFKSFQRIDINQLLQGVKEVSLKKEGDTITCMYLISEKSKSLSSKLSSSSTFKGSKAEYDKSNPTVIAVGAATIVNGRIDDAKKLALNRAMQNAVEQVLGTMLASTTQVQDLEKVKSKIFSNTVGFIENYRIKDEGASGDSYNVNGTFTVSKNKLYDSYKSMLQTIGDPYFYIDSGNDSELNEKFSEFFSDLGFKVTDMKSKAAYIVKLKGRFIDRINPTNSKDGTKLSLWVKMFNPETGKLLFTIQNDPRKATSYIGNKEMQRDIVIRNAFNQIKKPLHEKINKTVVQMVQSGREVFIKIENFSSAYKRFKGKWEKAIESVPGVSDVNTEMNSSTRTLKFTATYSGKIDTFADFLNDRLSKEIPKKYIPELIDQSSNNITYEY